MLLALFFQIFTACLVGHVLESTVCNQFLLFAWFHIYLKLNYKFCFHSMIESMMQHWIWNGMSYRWMSNAYINCLYNVVKIQFYFILVDRHNIRSTWTHVLRYEFEKIFHSKMIKLNFLNLHRFLREFTTLRCWSTPCWFHKWTIGRTIFSLNIEIKFWIDSLCFCFIKKDHYENERFGGLQ